MKTKSELFRDAKSGKIKLELIERYGRKINEKERCVRKVGKVQTNGFYLIDESGERSFLEINRASLMEYDGNELRIYDPGFRELDTKEKLVLCVCDERVKGDVILVYRVITES